MSSEIHPKAPTPARRHGRATESSAMEKITSASRQTARFDFDLDDLLHPAQAFEHPQHVVEDPDLTPNEKRVILASWASDACAIEAAPALRQAPGTRHPVRFDEVMNALRTLDQLAGNHLSPPRYRRILENRIPGMFGRRSRHQGTSNRGQAIN
jgi:hypothetical protein